MKYIRAIHKLAIYAFLFSLNFETMDLFNLHIDYLATKITISILLFFSILNFENSFAVKPFFKYLGVLGLYFTILTIISIININSVESAFFDLPFFLNILIFWILCNSTLRDENIMLKGLLLFASTSFLLSLFFIAGIGVSTQFEGRFSVFGINENQLGLELAASIFIIYSTVVTNKLHLAKWRYSLLLMLPFLLFFLFSTGSRVAFISLVLGAGFLVYFNKSIKTNYKIIIGTSFLLFFTVLWFAVLKNTVVAGRLFDTVNEGDLSSRDLIWVAVLQIIVNNFWTGVGITGYAAAMEQIFEQRASPHNVFLETICYTGVFGLIVFLFFIFRLIKGSILVNKYKKYMLPLLVILPITGNLFSGQVFDLKIAWVLFAFIASETRDLFINKKDETLQIDSVTS